MADTWSMPAGSGDRWPGDYELGRPGWPAAVVELPGVSPAAAVLDLGAGTGKLTRLLVPRFRHVVAVEPAEAMRRLLVEATPAAEALAGTAQAIPLPDGSVDAVFAAQAFHWFDDEGALTELERVLRPGGTFVVMWNLPAGPTEPSVDEAEAFLETRLPAGPLGYDPLDLGTPSYETDDWRRALDARRVATIQGAVLPHTQTLDRAGLLAFYASMGWLADLPDPERLPLLDELASLLTADEYRRPWATHLHWTSLG